MKIDFTIWDFNSTPFDNMMANIIASNTIQAQKARDFKDSFAGAKDENGNIDKVEITQWFHDEYGHRKPLCLGDKIIREIGNVGEQIGHEIERFGEDMQDEFKRASSSIKAEISREIEDVVSVGKKAEDELKRVWDKIF